MTQTTTHVNACDASIWLDDDAGVLTDISGSSNRVDLAFVRQMLTLKTESADYPDRVGDEMDLRATLKAVYSTADDEAFDILKLWHFSGSGLRSLHVYIGDDHYYGEFILKSLNIPTSVTNAGPVPVSAVLLVDGAVSTDEIMWFVDSVSGSDANDGRSASNPFATIAAVEAAVSAGESIGLARGSHWREELEITGAGMTVRAYDDGNDPILDACDIISNASFAKTGGRANVYEASVTLYTGGNQWVNAWEDGEFLERAADVADCDATAGSYYPSAETGAITLYVHASDSSDVTGNQKVYECSTRRFGLWIGDSATVTGIETRRNLSENGSLVTGRSAAVTDVMCRDGSKHNLYYEDGCTLDGVIAEDAYYGGTSAVMFVFNEGTPASLGLTHTDCIARLTGDTVALSDDHVSGYGGHRNTGGNFGAISFDGCTATDLYLGWSICRHGTSLTITDFTATRCQVIFSFTDADVPAATITSGIVNLESGNYLMICNAIAGNVAISEVTGSFENCGAAILFSAAVDLTLTDCVFDDSTSTVGNSRRAVQIGNAATDLIVDTCSFTGGNWREYIRTTAFSTIKSDYNTFGEDNAGPNSMNVGGVAYATLSTNWQGVVIANVSDLNGVATLQDANSTILA